MAEEQTGTRGHRCIISRGIIDIRSNVPFMLGGYSLDFHPVQDTPGEPGSIISINCALTGIEPDEHQMTVQSRRLYWSRGEPGNDYLYYERRLFRVLAARLVLTGLTGNKLGVRANSTYNNLVRIRTNILYPYGTLVQDVLAVSLLRHGYCALHGAAFGINGEAVLIIGLPGVGKSTVLFDALQRGYQFVSEDMMIADAGGNIHACPGASSFAYDLRRTQAKKEVAKTAYFKNRVMSTLAKTPAAWFLKWPFMDITSFFPINQRISIAKPLHIFILSNGLPHIGKLSIDEAVNMIMAVNFHTFAYYENTLLHEYSLLNPELNMYALLKKEESLIRGIVSQSYCHACTALKPRDFFPLMEKQLQSH